MSSRDEYATIRSAYIRILYSSMQVADRMHINVQVSHASMDTYGYMYTEGIRLQISLRIQKADTQATSRRLHRDARLQLSLLGPDMLFENGYRTTRLDHESTEEQLRLAYFINHDERLQHRSGRLRHLRSLRGDLTCGQLILTAFSDPTTALHARRFRPSHG